MILGSSKASLFYKGMLPGFFDLSDLTAPDIPANCALSLAVPLAEILFSLPRSTARGRF